MEHRHERAIISKHHVTALFTILNALRHNQASIHKGMAKENVTSSNVQEKVGEFLLYYMK